MNDNNPTETRLMNPLVLDSTIAQESSLDYAQMTETVYNYCQQYYPDIIEMAKILLGRSRNQFDNQVVIEGVTGSGKSMFTLCLICCYQYLHGRHFDFNKNICFIPNEGELKEEIGKLKKLDAYWIDEAIRSLDKKRWQNTDQIDLNHIVKTDRYKLNTIFYLIQRFAELTESFRNSNIFFRIYIIPHYAAVMYAKDIDKDIEDPWHTRVNLQIKYSKGSKTRYTALLNGESRLKNEAKLPNYVMHTLIPNLEEIPELSPLWRQFQDLRDKSREIMANKDTKKEDCQMNMYARKWRECFMAIEEEFRNVCKISRRQMWEKYLKDKITYETLRKKIHAAHAGEQRDERDENNSIVNKMICIQTLDPSNQADEAEVSH